MGHLVGIKFLQKYTGIKTTAMKKVINTIASTSEERLGDIFNTFSIQSIKEIFIIKPLNEPMIAPTM